MGGSVSSTATGAAVMPNSGTAANILRVPRARAPAALHTPLPKLRPAFKTVSISGQIFETDSPACNSYVCNSVTEIAFPIATDDRVSREERFARDDTFLVIYPWSSLPTFSDTKNKSTVS